MTTTTHVQGTADGRYHEGKSTRTIEKATKKIPSDLFLFAAFGCIGASAILQFTGAKEKSLFVGQWVPTLLLLGTYNKMVKLLGHDGSPRT